MTTRFHNWPIQRKLTAIMVATSSLALLLASITFGLNDILSSSRILISQTSTLADVIGRNSTAALTFHDPAAATETLAALRSETHILSAATLTADGRVFAAYTSNQPDECEEAPLLSAPPARRTVPIRRKCLRSHPADSVERGAHRLGAHPV